MSGGEQQMLAVGRGLMLKPRLLMLDEPSLGLAPVMTDVTFEKIGEIHEMGTAILLVEQNVSRALSLVQRAYVLESGTRHHARHAAPSSPTTSRCRRRIWGFSMQVLTVASSPRYEHQRYFIFRCGFKQPRSSVEYAQSTPLFGQVRRCRDLMRSLPLVGR